MTDWDALYRRLWREIVAQEGRVDEGALPFAERLVETLRKDGFEMGPNAEERVAEYLQGMDRLIKSGIEAALKLAVADGVMHSTLARELAREAFTRRWPDGLTLSNRTWAWKNAMRDGVQRVLADGAAQVAAVNRLVFDMQRAIERAGSKFEIAALEWDDWAADLFATGRRVIRDPGTREVWLKTLADTRRHIGELRETGTKNAALNTYRQMVKAVRKGDEALLGSALKWWSYDKQLYLLKRIARTEMSTAMHRAAIAATADEDLVIGYHWRLASTHPEPDICDYYASIEMGLGKGVWSKETVPPEKAHPHCMCTLIPRVTKVKEKGSQSYAEFVRGTSPERRAQILPKWATALNAQGVQLEKMVREDGLGLLTMREMRERLGAERFDAMLAKFET